MTDTVAPPLNSHCQPLDRACSSTTCDMCSHWKDQLDVQATTLTQLEDRLIERDLTLARLQQDIQQLNTKYVAVIDRASELQHQKDLVELDLEELSCKLFEEANGMVANEKRENWRLETKLQSVQQQLGDEQAQLAELRQRLLQWDQDEQQRYWCQQDQLQKQQQQQNYKRPIFYNNSTGIDTTTFTDEKYDTCHYRNSAGSVDNQPFSEALKKKKDDDDDSGTKETTDSNNSDQQHQEQCLPVSPTPSALKQYAITSVTHNQIQWETFQHFVQLSHTVSLKKLHQFTYLRACQIEDVEPCLRFGFRSRLSPKKMMNYLLQRSCFIQHIPMENNNQRQQEASIPHSSITSSVTLQWPLLWERWYPNKTNSLNDTLISATTTECAACGESHQSNDGNDLVNTIDYQFKMDEKDNWLPIDQHCRDRLVAVCEFFVFIRNIHSRLYAHRTIDDLYYENIRLRLQMSFSRIGTLSDDTGAYGFGKSCPPLDQDDASDGSVSSFYPSTPK